MNSSSLSMRSSLASPVKLARGTQAARGAVSRRALPTAPRASTAIAGPEYAAISKALQEARSLPPSMRQQALADAGKLVRTSLNALQAASDNKLLWGAYVGKAKRRNVFVGDLRMQGIKDPTVIGKASLQDRDSVFNFMAVVTVSTSLTAVVIGNVLPGDWGYFGSYLVGGISLVVLGIGSVNPGILQWALDKLARVDQKYRERILAHEAAHFLVGYCLGVPVTSYSVDIGTEHIEMVDAALDRTIFSKKFEDDELDTLSVVAMSGVAAEALRYEDVRGQGQDLMDLQRMINRSAKPLNGEEQKSITRWAVWQAANIIKNQKASHEALMACLERNAPVEECIQAIEAAAVPPPQ